MSPEQPYYQASLPLFESSDEQRAQQLHEALAPYISTPHLRRLASDNGDLYEALRTNNVPPELLDLLDLISILLRPTKREAITSPAEVAALLMVEMGFLMQEQLRVVCLDTKNHLQKIHLAYQGTVNSSDIRIAEIFREPIRLNSAAIIVAHNHPSSCVEPSPPDILVTRQIVDAGNLLSIEVLDHIILGQGQWISLRERRLGFSS